MRFVPVLLLTVCLFCSGCGPEPQNDTVAESRPTQTIASVNDNQPEKSVQRPLNEGSGWHFFRGNPTSTGVATSSLSEKLSVLWQHEIPNGAFEGTPIIVGGNVKRAYIGDADGKLLAFNLETGNVEWEFDSDIGYVTAPAYKDDKIFVGDMDGKFYCLNDQGEQVWEFQADDSIDSSANFHKNLVLFGSRDARLYALDQDSGEEVWRLETEDQVRCGITVVQGRAFVAGCDGALHIIDLDTGKEVDSVLIDSPTGVTPAARKDRVFVGTEQAGFLAIDLKNIELKWKFNHSEGNLSTRSSPALKGNHVVFGASDRMVYSLDPVTGQKNWATELKSGIESSPVIVNDRVFVGSTDGRLYELDLESGRIVWEKQFDGGFIGSPAVAFGRLVIATDRGVVYCLG